MNHEKNTKKKKKHDPIMHIMIDQEQINKQNGPNRFYKLVPTRNWEIGAQTQP